MKQWVSNQDGLDNLQLLDVAEPTELREGEVLVKINRVSLNYRDTEGGFAPYTRVFSWSINNDGD